MASGISLANKCQLIFGTAVVVIITATLAVPWVSSRTGVREGQVEEARRIADAWLSHRLELGLFSLPSVASDPPTGELALELSFVRVDSIVPGDPDSFASIALERFLAFPDENEYTEERELADQTVYQYARTIRESELRTIRDASVSVFTGSALEPGIVDPLRAILVVTRNTQFAEGQLLRSRIYIIAAGIAGSLLAIAVFHLVLTKLIFSPVRKLRRTTEIVQAGDLTVRSEIRTGDEFEQLAGAFNAMLDRIEHGRRELEAINRSLDLRVDELAQVNVGLDESNRLKNEFLANVSHELRTPLNSIIGFAELLLEIARSENAADSKRTRYISNIVTSGRSLLEMINELLDMAKIEAGRMEVSVEPTSIADLLEGLARIMGPLAEQKSIELTTEVGARVPMVDTDPGKLQQILYNFLSNAIKFTPESGTVTLSADRVTRQDGEQGVRIAVADSGEGIPDDMQDVIFEKFRQVNAGHTREHQGTGLGLAICRELAALLGASVSFVSEPGRGATFFVDVPCVFRVEESQPLMG